MPLVGNMFVSFYKGCLLVPEDRSSPRDRCCLLFFILLVLLKFLYSLVFSLVATSDSPSISSLGSLQNCQFGQGQFFHPFFSFFLHGFLELCNEWLYRGICHPLSYVLILFLMCFILSKKKKKKKVLQRIDVTPSFVHLKVGCWLLDRSSSLWNFCFHCSIWIKFSPLYYLHVSLSLPFRPLLAYCLLSPY